jgi:acetyltransferase-like isoleucine patch superfamily enzyme
MKLIWTKHAVQRGYMRLGRYGMDTIESKIRKNINRAKPNKEMNSALIPFKIGRKKCIAVVLPEGETGSIGIIKSLYTISEEKHRAIFGKNKK